MPDGTEEGFGELVGILVHDWLSLDGGSENVFEQLSALFPDAARFCLWNESCGRFRDIDETFLARTPLRGHKELALPLMPLAWRLLPKQQADWVLCSSHAFAHHASFRGPAADAPKFVYAHTPARYIWEPELDGRGVGAAARLVANSLKPLDRRRAREAAAIAANSHFVAERIERVWGRESTVIFPAVDVATFSSEEDDLSDDEARILEELPTQFLLGASRFIRYKRLDRVISMGATTGMPVVLAGEGPDKERLAQLAEESPSPVHFVGRLSTEGLRALYRRSTALVFPPIEDFGIMPVEAMASGTPVVASAVGGTAETVVDGQTGVLMREWSKDEELAAMATLSNVSAAACRRRADEFSPEVFDRRILDWMGAVLNP